MKPKPHSHRTTNTFKFHGFHKKIKDIKVNSRKYIISKLETDNDTETFLVETLRKWTELNLTQEFQDFKSELGSDIQNINQVLLNQSHIAETFKSHFTASDSSSLAPILHALVAFARDIPDEFYNEHFYNFFPMLVSIVSSYRRNHEVLENVFVCLVSLFTVLRKYIESDIDSKASENRKDCNWFYVKTDFCSLFSKRYPWYVNELAAQSLGAFIKNVSLKVKRKIFTVCLKRACKFDDEIEGVGRIMFNSIKLDVLRRLHSSTTATLSLFLDLAIKKVPEEASVQATLFCLRQLAFHVTDGSQGIQTSWQETWNLDAKLVWPVLFNKLKEELSMEPEGTECSESVASILKFIYELVQFKHSVLVIDFDELLKHLTEFSNYKLTDDIGKVIGEIAAKILVSHHYEDPENIEDFLNFFVYSSINVSIKLDFIANTKDSQYFDNYIIEIYCHLIINLLSTNEDEQVPKLVVNSISEILNSKISPVRTAADLESLEEYFLNFESALESNSHLPNVVSPSKIIEDILEKGISSDLSNIEEILLCCFILPRIQPLEKEDFTPFLFWILKESMDMINKEVTPLIEEDFESKTKKRKSDVDTRMDINFNINPNSNDKSRQLIFLISVIVETLYHILSVQDFLSAFAEKELISLTMNCEMYRENVFLLKALDIYLSTLKSESDLDVDDLMSLYKILAPSLSSHKAVVRQLTCHIFSLFPLSIDEEEENIFELMFEVESSPVSPLAFKERLRLMAKLRPDRCKLDSPKVELFQQAPILFLIGQLFINFKDIWPATNDLIVKWALALDEEVFWSIWHSKLKIAAHFCMRNLCDKGLEDETNTNFENSSISQIHETILSHPGYAHLSVNINHIHFRESLWKVMQNFPQICERKNRDVVTLFLDFLHNELFPVDYSVAPTQDISLSSNYEADDLDETNEVAEEELNMNVVEDNSRELNVLEPKERVKKAPTKSLCAHLALLGKFHNLKVLYKAKEIEDILYEFLSYPYSEVQKLSLECIFLYNHKFLTPYRSNLRNILDGKTFKSEITSFDIEDTGDDESSLKSEHRAQFMPFLMRIVYGKMLSKSNNKSEGGLNNAARRAIVLRFLAGSNEAELETFFNLTFDFVLHHLDGTPMEIVERVKSNIDPKCVIPLKRSVGSLGTLDDIFEKISYQIESKRPFFLKVILFFLSTSTNLLDKREEIAPRFHHQLKTIRQQAMLKLIHFFGDFMDYKWSNSEIDAVFEAAVWPLLARLPDEGVYSATTLLKLFVLWSENPCYHILLAKHAQNDLTLSPMPYVIRLLNNPKTSVKVINVIYNMIEHLLGQVPVDPDEENEDEILTPEDVFVEPLKGVLPLEKLAKQRNLSNLTTGESVILHCMSGIFTNVKKSLYKIKSKNILKKLNLSILTQLAQWTKKDNESIKILDTFVPLVTKSSTSKQGKEIELLEVCTRLLSVTNTEKYTKIFLRMFSHFNSRNARNALCNVIKVICKDQERQETLAKWCSGLNGWKEGTLNEVDSELRVKCYREIGEFLDEKEVVDENILIFLIHQNMWTIYNSSDQSLNSLAVICMERVLNAMERASRTLKIKSLLDDDLLPLLKSGLTNKVEKTRDSVMLILGNCIKKCHSFHSLLGDLLVLLNEDDVEIDFFVNLTHLQRGKRAKAFVRLAESINEKKWEFQMETITDYILPMINAYLFNDYASDSYILDGCVSCVGAIAKILPWKHYQNMLQHHLTQITKESKHLKLSVRLLECIINSFHEDLSEVVKREDMKNANKEWNNSYVSDDEYENDLIPSINKIKLSSNSEIDVVYKTLTANLVPKIERALAKRSEADSSHKLNKKKFQEDEDIKRIPLALSLVKLLKLLPKHFLASKINGVLMKLISYQKSRAESIRKESRVMLIKVMEELGGSYFSYLVRDMISILDKGYQTHVLVFSLHAVLIALQSQLTAANISHCLTDTVDICMQDLFGDKSEEKEVVKLTNKFKEMKAEKGYAILGILSQSIGVEDVETLMLPVKQKLLTHDKKIVNKIIVCLQKIGNGLLLNKNLSVEQKSLLVYGIMKEKIRDLNISDKPVPKSSNKPVKVDCLLIEPEPKKGGLIPKTNVKSTSHALVEFALNLLYSLLRKGYLKPSNSKDCGLLDPYLPLMSDCLLSEYPETSIQALHVISCLIKFPLPSLKEGIATITGQMFVILNKFATSTLNKGKLFELVQLNFKVISMIIKEVSYYSIEEEHYKVLLCYAKNNLEDCTLHHSSFIILNALISRKLNDDEFHELMIAVRDLSITSPLMNMLDQARITYFKYIFAYQKSKKSRIGVLLHFIWNVSYEVNSGRLSVLMMLNDLMRELQTDFSQEDEVTVWFKLTSQLMVEKETEHKSLIKKMLKGLFKKSSRKNLLLDKCAALLVENTGEDKSQNAVATRMASQSLVSMLDAYEKDNDQVLFERILPRISELLHPSCYVLPETNDTTQLKDDALNFDLALISLLELLMKLMDLFMSKHVKKFLSSVGEDAWSHVQDHLLYPNLQVRFNASICIGRLFALFPVEKKFVPSIASKPEMFKSLIADLCEQLNSQCPVESPILNQLGLSVIRNLIYLVRQASKIKFRAFMFRQSDNCEVDIERDSQTTKEPENIDNSDFVTAAIWVLYRVGNMAYLELRNKKRVCTYKRECFLNLIAGIIVVMGDDFTKSHRIQSYVLHHLTRELSDKKLLGRLRKKTQEVSDIVSEKIGLQKYTEEVMRIQENLEKKRAERKSITRQKMVTDQEFATKKKVKKNEAKKVSKKRKLVELKLKPTRKKLKNMAYST